MHSQNTDLSHLTFLPLIFRESGKVQQDYWKAWADLKKNLNE